jgi:hypothetical protein
LNMHPILDATGLARQLALSIAVALCLILPLAPVAGSDDTYAASSEQPAGRQLAYHKMTDAEMLAYRAIFGVRDASTDYNVLVDGHGTGKAPPTEEAYDALPGQMNVLDYVEPMALPAAFDLSESPSFPQVDSQGQQGSCTGWAVTYYAYGYIEAVDCGWTEAKSGNTSQLLSPAWTYNKVNGGVDRGSWEWDNIMILKDWGTSTMAELPYDDDDWTEWGSPRAFREAPLHRVHEGFRVPYVGESTVETVKTLVYGGTPVTFGLDANDYFRGFRDDNYIISAAEYNSERPNHANTFVGFDDSITDDGEVGAFRVVNSWGSAWGEDGYYWLTYDAFMEMSHLLDLCFVEDIEDYSPSMRAVWQFDPAPSRDVPTEVAIGAYGAAEGSKSPYYWTSSDTTLKFPTYMCLDVTEFESIYDAGTDDFYISMEATGAPGTLEGFKVELFETSYDPAAPTQVSGEAWNDPQTTPGHIDTSFQYYSPISLADALDLSAPLATDGDVLWVGVDHEWICGGDAAQSGNIDDSEESRMSVEVLGPLTIGFEWKVSSEAGDDLLAFDVDGVELCTISGDVDWEARSFDLDEGAHVASWTYVKGASGSDLDDCGWVDNLTLSSAVQQPPVAHFVLFPPIGDVMTVFEFDASGSSDPDDPNAVLLTRWDWDGDGTWDTDWSEQLVAHHTFDTPDEYTVRLEVMDSDGLTDDFERQVTVLELIPEFGEIIGPVAATITALMVVFLSARRRRASSGGL